MIRGQLKIILAAIALLALACGMGGGEDEAYTLLEDTEVRYKILSFEESGRQPRQGDMLKLSLYLLESDSIYWQSEGPQIIQFPGNEDGLIEHFWKFQAGDSISFLFDDASFIETFKLRTPELKDEVELVVKLLSVMDESSWLRAKHVSTGLKAEHEQQKILDYIASRTNPARFVYNQGMWCASSGNDSLGRFSADEELLVMYEAFLLDGSLIDTRTSPEDALSYSIGMQGQLIPGLTAAIRVMDRSEDLELIIPSKLAFGASGSAEDIVPPWTPVRYVLKVASKADSD